MQLWTIRNVCLIFTGDKSTHVPALLLCSVLVLLALLSLVDVFSSISADAKRKVKVGIPFARPGPTHPKLVGAAGMVPNNMRKHNWKLPK